ncbi:Glycosyltransferase involved in cell wall bisynthesis [bacterium A37T11]|nr:Glycosyltransferase involved in cell wall bisynthesis [bacterium A37T11]
MDIIFNPPENSENQYIRILVDQLRERGYQIHSLDNLLSAGRTHFRSIRLVHLNWFENVDDSSFLVALRSFMRKMVVLTVIRFSGKKLVWTMHNRASHEKKLSFFSRTLTWFLIRWSDRIIIHSRQTEYLIRAQYPSATQKMVYYPHPHFIGAYQQPESKSGENGTTLSLLFTGMVKPYKNLELLIRVVSEFKDTVHLTIAGRAVNPSYEQELRWLGSAASNISLVLKFVPDEELLELISACDALVLPYDMASSLNSGTVILAFSCKKTVICPEIGTITDLGERQDLTFHYRYKNPEEHANALRQQIKKAVRLKQENPNTFTRLGQQLYNYVQAENSPEKAGDLLDGTYRLLTESKK